MRVCFIFFLCFFSLFFFFFSSRRRHTRSLCDWSSDVCSSDLFNVIERGGVRVAVIGLALPATPETTSPRNVRGLAFGNGAQAVRRVLPQARAAADYVIVLARSEEHTSELQSHSDLVCRLLLEKKKK